MRRVAHSGPVHLPFIVHEVGQVAANIRKVRPPEPYKGKGIKYLEEKIRRKLVSQVRDKNYGKQSENTFCRTVPSPCYCPAENLRNTRTPTFERLS
jgi:hypothetical protein